MATISDDDTNDNDPTFDPEDLDPTFDPDERYDPYGNGNFFFWCSRCGESVPVPDSIRICSVCQEEVANEAARARALDQPDHDDHDDHDELGAQQARDERRNEKRTRPKTGSSHNP
jgi:hypothetical protein